jgi:hypothetical protein
VQTRKISVRERALSKAFFAAAGNWHKYCSFAVRSILPTRKIQSSQNTLFTQPI